MSRKEMQFNMDNLPKVEINGVPYKELTDNERISFMNFFAGVMCMSGLLTDLERKKVFERSCNLPLPTAG